MRLTPDPAWVQQYREIGGVLDFAFFTDAGDADAVLRSAIGQAIERAIAPGRGQTGGRLPEESPVDHDRIGGLTCRKLTREQFFGSRADGRTRDLIPRGTYQVFDRWRLFIPTYRRLEALRLAGATLTRGGSPIPDLWAGGEFAYAFAEPPYNLWATPGLVQSIFDAVCDDVLPPGESCIILDWGSPALPDVCSSYFLPGTEWWGVFLFTIYVPSRRRLTVISGASTD